MLLFQKITNKGMNFLGDATARVTQAIYGEHSVSGTIYGEIPGRNFGNGWRVKVNDEWYRITYIRKIGLRGSQRVEFDGVHEVVYTLQKTCQYEVVTQTKGPKDWLQFCNNPSSVVLDDTGVDGETVMKENFGLDTCWSLFQNIMKQYGLYCKTSQNTIKIFRGFQTGHAPGIIRSGLNLLRMELEQDSTNYATYQKGFGAYLDEKNPQKGRITAEYSVEGANDIDKKRIELPPFSDERFKHETSLRQQLKKNLDNLKKDTIAVDVTEILDASGRVFIPEIGTCVRVIDDSTDFNQYCRIDKVIVEIDINGTTSLKGIECGLIN